VFLRVISMGSLSKSANSRCIPSGHYRQYLIPLTLLLSDVDAMVDAIYGL
jgi:hypothetical protein